MKLPSLLAPLALASPAALAQESAVGFDPVLRDLLPGAAPEARAAAFAAVERFPEPRYFAPLVDLLRHAETAEEWFAILDAGSAVLDEDLRALQRPWRRLSLRLAGLGDPRLPAGYAEWKGRLLADAVDERFTRFLNADTVAAVPLEEVVWGGVGVGGIPALQDPATVPAAAATWLLPEEPVVGLSIGGEARAYPLRILDWHELANDELGGRGIALTWCTLCGAAVVFETDVGDERLRFDSSGLLMRSNKLMFDAGTDTLWNQLTGEPVVGPLAAVDEPAVLEVLSSEIVPWATWRARNPGTTVVDRATGFERDYRPGAAYGDYFGSAGTMFPAPGELGEDPARAKRRRVAVRAPFGTRTYDVERVRRAGWLRDEIAGRGVLLVATRPRAARPLPGVWATALAQAGLGPVEDLGQLGSGEVDAVLSGDPELLAALGLEDLLALDWSVRASLLEGRVVGDALVRVDSPLRELAASRGLADGVRAFEVGERRFEAGPEPETLLDGSGAAWSVTESGLVGPADELLPRLPAHGLFAFAAETFDFASSIDSDGR